MSLLDLEGRCFLLLGLGNRKSVSWAVGQALEAEGARVVYSARTAERRDALGKLLDGRPCVVADFAASEGAAGLPAQLEQLGVTTLDGLLHAVAFARFSQEHPDFLDTQRAAFDEAMHISAFSLVEVVRALRGHLLPQASIVGVGISSHVAAPTYGLMSPVKQALEGCMRYVAKSLSRDSEIRCNLVNAGPLKTKSSAGIPGFLDNFLYAEKMTLRKRALETAEVARVIAFLLSPASSGINAQCVTVNAGMDENYFDAELVRLSLRPERDTPANTTPEAGP